MKIFRLSLLFCFCAWVGGVCATEMTPDFTNPEAVFGDLRQRIDACAGAGANCSVSCGYAMKTLKNYLKSNPGGDASIFKQRWQTCFDAFRNDGITLSDGSTDTTPGATEASSSQTVDFSNHEAVVTGISAFMAQCGEQLDCQKSCKSALKSMNNFNHPQPHYANLRKSKWESCRKSLPGQMAEKGGPNASLDISKFVIAGLPLGGNMKSVEDRLFLLEAHGYFKEPNQEYSAVVLSRGKRSPGPDIIRNYQGTIREPTVTVHFEASADGKVYQIQFEQKEALQIEAVQSALVERFGKPTRYQGRYLIWGCEAGVNQGTCIKANVSEKAMKIWAFTEDVKKGCYATYEQNVLAAKGIKSGAKF